MKLLIADDEPLIQVGLKSMLDYRALDIEICGVASNGDMAYELIENESPDIVITDIQMPCSTGLELAKKCRESFGQIPVFIFLTNFEEFDYVKTALSFQAVDYMIKLDLTPEVLEQSILKAKEQVLLYRNNTSSSSEALNNIILLREHFYSKLLNNLFEKPEDFYHHAGELGLSFDYSGYVAAQMEIVVNQPSVLESEQIFKIYGCTVQMFRELIQKHIPCQIVILDTHFFAVVFFIGDEHVGEWKEYVKQALERTFEMIYNYYSVTILSGIGRMVEEPMTLSSSHYDARQLTPYFHADKTILFFDEQPDSHALRNVFNLSLFRDEIRKAFEKFDEVALHDIFGNIIELLPYEQEYYIQALDAASGILHLTTTLLSDGADIANQIFKNDRDSYQSLYRQKSPEQIISWLNMLERGLCSAFIEKKSNQKNYLVENARKYIDEHLHERLMLQDIADELEVTPNHLSQLFKKVMNMGVTEYITTQKIKESKRLLNQGNRKVYEVADMLGFESAFYFSKVFKKMTGASPKDFRNRNL